MLTVESVDFGYDIRRPLFQGLSFTVETGQIASVVGTSGVGKTSLLHLLAGYERPNRGVVAVNRQPVTGPSPRLGVVQQDLALFPWLTVMGNLCFGLKMQKMPARLQEQRAQHYLDLVGLSGYGDTLVSRLSGGMQQRVALARTLINEPDILLLDEPFSALDERRRESLQEELLRIHRQQRLTTVVVTHSIAEAVYLSDFVVVLAGRPAMVTARIPVWLPHRDTSIRRHRDFLSSVQEIAHFLDETAPTGTNDQSEGEAPCDLIESLHTV